MKTVLPLPLVAFLFLATTLGCVRVVEAPPESEPPLAEVLPMQTVEVETEVEPLDVFDFANCTALREVHPGGVEQGHRAYKADMDRDGDGVACEVEGVDPAAAPYANCGELRAEHPEGVENGHWAYLARMDRDGDGWACEP